MHTVLETKVNIKYTHTNAGTDGNPRENITQSGQCYEL